MPGQISCWVGTKSQYTCAAELSEELPSMASLAKAY
jgi:hypothetical protein